MRQILQNVRSGRQDVCEVPDAVLSGSGVLVATQCSAVSAGTERMIVEFSKKGFIGKAKSRPDDVKKVLSKIKRDGLKATLNSVFTRLNQPMPLGYSTSGIVLAVSPDVTHVKPGDRVACGGANYAVHAEMIFVPGNLVVAVPDNVEFDQACFATLGSVAMQGVRIADLVLGEKVAVIGLGLLGLITAQIAKAAGCRVIGADPDQARCALGRELGIDYVCSMQELSATADSCTNNVGVDAAIITAATSSNEPIEVAAAICRKKGRISVVGAVKMDLPRSSFYKKELELRLSCSYGPGRYDKQYEEKGIDYPQAYVPWTEQRNMACIIDLISQRRMDMRPLISHRFAIEDAEKAYALVRGETNEPYLGIVIMYPPVADRTPMPSVRMSEPTEGASPKNTVNIGVIGAGTFAGITMLPAFRKISGIRHVCLAEREGRIGKHTAEKFGFEKIVSDHAQLLNDKDVDIVFVTTRHDTHAPLLIESLKAGKHVMVEKPLCIREDELPEIIDVAEANPGRIVMVGYNRRFAPMSVDLKERFRGKGPLCINYICNAGFSPQDSWTRDIEIGGGRIIGEGCHFIDWMIWLTDSQPVTVYSQSVGRENASTLKNDNVTISIQLKDGSIGVVSYFACGDKSAVKEHIRVFGGGCLGIIDDFKHGSFTSGGTTARLHGGSKGHLEEWQAVISAVKENKASPIPLEELVCSTWTTFKAMESLQIAQPIDI
jgi:polar amino acid transport system substrate-binding protein